MIWLADDSRAGTEVMLSAAAGRAGRRRRARRLAASRARRAARLDHPDLARVVECGVHEHWPYVAVDRRAGVTLDEWLAEHPQPTTDEAALWIDEVLRGLAFAHDAGVAHLDLQFHSLLVNERGQIARDGARGRAHESARTMPRPRRDNDRAMPLDPSMLRAQRAPPSATCSPAACCCTACSPASRRSASPTPAGDRAPGAARPRVRAPAVDHAASDPRAAARDRQSQHRGAGAPALPQRAHLPRRAQRLARGAVRRRRRPGRAAARSPAHRRPPAGAARARRRGCSGSRRSRASAPTRSRAHLLPDLALSFELLRTINSAQVQGTQIAGNGPVLTLRRVVALIGVDGVRLAANSLRDWPGPLDDAGAKALLAAIDRVRLAGHTAQALRPAGYDGEVGLPDRGAAEPRPADAALPLRRRGRADPAADAAGAGRAASEPEQPGLDEAAAATPCSASTSRPSASRSRATGAWATRSCT